MQISELKNVVGEVAEGGVAKIKFFGHVNQAMTTQFNQEFEFLENLVKPSRIDILINSEGGSVLHGMSSFAVIQNSSVKTRCINEGLAASMASVILVAGDETYVKDYSVIMIHQPFSSDSASDTVNPAVQAFSKQLETIYHKKFGIPKAKVRDIMDGKQGQDGTYFDASEAVRAGIIPNVIQTKQISVSDVHAMLQKTESTSIIQAYFDDISNDQGSDFKPVDDDSTILIQEKPSIEADKSTQNNINYMPDNETVRFVEASIATQLGMKQYDPNAISARLAELAGVEATLASVQAKHDTLQIELEAKTLAAETLQNNLESAQAKLDIYAQAEAKAVAEENKALVLAAVEVGKIPNTEAEISKWMERVTANAKLVKEVLADLPVREKISKEISDDPENAAAAAASAVSAEQELALKVNEAVGKDFAFQKLD